LAVHISAVHGSSIASAKDTALALIVNSNIMTDILNKTFLKCDECTEEFEYQTECEQHKNIQRISLEELGIPKLPEILPRKKQMSVLKVMNAEMTMTLIRIQKLTKQAIEKNSLFKIRKLSVKCVIPPSDSKVG
jgi:hypothetical protein